MATSSQSVQTAVSTQGLFKYAMLRRVGQNVRLATGIEAPTHWSTRDWQSGVSVSIEAFEAGSTYYCVLSSACSVNNELRLDVAGRLSVGGLGAVVGRATSAGAAGDSVQFIYEPEGGGGAPGGGITSSQANALITGDVSYDGTVNIIDDTSGFYIVATTDGGPQTLTLSGAKAHKVFNKGPDAITIGSTVVGKDEEWLFPAGGGTPVHVNVDEIALRATSNFPATGAGSLQDLSSNLGIRADTLEQFAVNSDGETQKIRELYSINTDDIANAPSSPTNIPVGEERDGMLSLKQYIAPGTTQVLRTDLMQYRLLPVAGWFPITIQDSRNRDPDVTIETDGVAEDVSPTLAAIQETPAYASYEPTVGDTVNVVRTDLGLIEIYEVSAIVGVPATSITTTQVSKRPVISMPPVLMFNAEKYGSAMQFDGVDDAVTVPVGVGLWTTNDSIRVDFTMDQPPSVGENAVIVNHGQNNANCWTLHQINTNLHATMKIAGVIYGAVIPAWQVGRYSILWTKLPSASIAVTMPDGTVINDTIASEPVLTTGNGDINIGKRGGVNDRFFSGVIRDLDFYDESDVLVHSLGGRGPAAGDWLNPAGGIDGVVEGSPNTARVLAPTNASGVLETLVHSAFENEQGFFIHNATPASESGAYRSTDLGGALPFRVWEQTDPFTGSLQEATGCAPLAAITTATAPTLLTGFFAEYPFHVTGDFDVNAFFAALAVPSHSTTVVLKNVGVGNLDYTDPDTSTLLSYPRGNIVSFVNCNGSWSRR